MDVGIVAGELSGDFLGAGLIKELRHQLLADPLHSLKNISGMGGSQMIAAGCQSLYDIERLAVMGLIEPLRRLPELIRIRRNLYSYFTRYRPDVFIGIDSPDFNLGLELKLRRTGIPVVHYVSPSVWAWRKRRINIIAKAVNLVLTLFPFEADFYRDHNVPACFVGHPLADQIPLQPDQQVARKALGLEPDGAYIALLPGSRRNEIQYLGEVFIETAKLCWQEKPNLRFITSSPNSARHREFQQHCQRMAPDLPIQYFEEKTHAVMAAADVVLVASGTATLETMLFKRPMVIAYRMANLTYQIARHLVKIPFVGLPNLLANQLVVPEFIQDAAEPKKLAVALLHYLEHPEEAQRLQSIFTSIHQQLRQNANQKAAEAVLQLLT